MRHFPVFLRVKDKRVLVTGAQETAIAKLRLLLKTEAEIVVFAETADALVCEWAKEGLMTLH